jgi:Family of unknown function (DUF6065)
MPDPATPIARFYRLMEQARPPMRADRSAAGTLPTRAYRYCEAVTSATGYGWWVFPPAGLRFIWDGADIFWICEGMDDWEPLSPSAQLPGFSDAFDAAAPAALAGCAPPMLTALPEPGALQIWTGLMVRTLPGWHLLVRAPANLPAPGGIALYEGIVETDRWFGPLFTNLRFTRSHSPITLRPDFPLLQVQPVRAETYRDAVLDSTGLVPGLTDLDATDWDDYRHSIVIPNEDPDRPFGAYAKAARRRRKSDIPPGTAAGTTGGGCPMRGVVLA